MKHILLTAFEPFGGETINPALEIARALAEYSHPNASLRALTVPVTFAEAAQAVLSELEGRRYDAVLMLGQAGGRATVTVERVAINVNDASIPDNAGAQPCDEPIAPDGAPAYFATLPIKAIVAAIREAGVPANISNSAGTFVCNSLMYSVLRHLHGSGVPAGFIHVPWLPEQGERHSNAPSMPLEDMTRAIRAAIDLIAE